MKKIRATITITVAVMLLTACKSEYDEEYDIVNDTDSTVTVLLNGKFGEGWLNENHLISPHTTKSIRSGDMGCRDRRSLEYWITKGVLGDRVTLLVDSVTITTWYSSDTLDERSPYNFRSNFYEYHEHSTALGCPATFNVYIWTITDELINN